MVVTEKDGKYCERDRHTEKRECAREKDTIPTTSLFGFSLRIETRKAILRKGEILFTRTSDKTVQIHTNMKKEKPKERGRERERQSQQKNGSYCKSVSCVLQISWFPVVQVNHYQGEYWRPKVRESHLWTMNYHQMQSSERMVHHRMPRACNHPWRTWSCPGAANCSMMRDHEQLSARYEHGVVNYWNAETLSHSYYTWMARMRRDGIDRCLLDNPLSSTLTPLWIRRWQLRLPCCPKRLWQIGHSNG